MANPATVDRPRHDERIRFPEAMELLRREGVRSFCILPLTTAHRRLGGIGFGSQRVDAYREADMEFLRYVAGQVAVAVDNALSHQDAQALQHQLERERDRLRLLLDLNNNIVSNLDLRETAARHFHQRSASDAV